MSTAHGGAEKRRCSLTQVCSTLTGCRWSNQRLGHGPMYGATERCRGPRPWRYDPMDFILPKEVEQIAAAAGLVRVGVVRIVRSDYLKETAHKAIAVHLPTGFSFRWSGAASADLAERWVLEG